MKKHSLLLTLLFLLTTAVMGADITTTYVAATPDVNGNVSSFSVDVLHNFAGKERIEIDYVLPSGVVDMSITRNFDPNTVRTYTFEVDPAVPANTTFKIIVHYPDGTTETRMLNEPNGPLPVTLVEFQALRQGKKVNLNWTTASEKNTSHFEVQRSVDGVKFETIGTVKANGNSSNLVRYNFTDNTSGQAYYRLKNVDFDGYTEYTKIVYIKDNAITELNLRVNNQILIKEIGTGETITNIEFRNVAGQVIYSTKSLTPVTFKHHGITVVTIYTNSNAYQAKMLF